MIEKPSIEQELYDCYKDVSGCAHFALSLFQTGHFSDTLSARIAKVLESLSQQQVYAIINRLDEQKLFAERPLTELSDQQFALQRQQAATKLVVLIAPKEHEIHLSHRNLWDTVSISNQLPNKL